MATFNYVLGITDYNGSTVTFTTAPYQLARGGYKPLTADEREAMVSEDVVVRIKDNSSTANLDEFRSLQSLLIQASRAQDNRSLSKVYLFWKESAGADEYRSELLKGRAEWTDTALDYEYWLGDTQFAEIQWDRRNWWEGPEAVVTLSNNNGTAGTAGVTVYNVHDLVGTPPNQRVNFVSIAGTAIAGELDASTRLEFTNTYASDNLYHIWIGQTYTDPANIVWFFDANSATVGGGGSAVVSASASGGTFSRYTLSSGSEQTMWTWTITPGQMTAFSSRFYKAMMRLFLTVDTNVRYRIQIRWVNTVIWESGLVSLSGSVYATIIRDLATIKLPPWTHTPSNSQAFDLVLRGYQTTGSPIVINLDSIQLIPVDGWRFLAAVGYGFEENYVIYDDGLDDKIYIDNGSKNAYGGNIVGYGLPLKLRPGKDQRLYFQTHSNVINSAPIDRTGSIVLYYRPRRLSL